MLRFIKNSLILICLLGATEVCAGTVVMKFTTPEGKTIAAGTIQITETPYGLLFTPQVHGVGSAGIHGFHVHEHADCSKNAMAAGGHLDPARTNKHVGPYQDHGHLGDLPALYAAVDGSITLPVLAPRLKHLSQIKNHSLMIHAGGDNYSDLPKALGGGGNRMICGVIKN
jgi:superoxide dismutase, Cu-Zn family